ncbi:hypothetical protein A3H80_01750 [Candidatus Roizmanbacteria bacterium RIFCSPLOWO2_02_FULL_37_19]|uniref:Sortase n=1 Tax=Candidatus Roizmanbacteria bacterium RIFCSPHIGHO2_02_FULL_37_24 TaxID=1802037 RepID=A0A1F7GWY8_9BACT|nr:MAG: hypothetical protein A2862_00080 [Candidatus Roizmanbacteria bacterium RIFCSPHIGHO2_01_FULL_38_41]OGK23499.1 MAG: hypothetical protein A3C24_01750 [Candidatus Roizmanbacteria bacterium RIFCSPHIGHO2_02_FULL_37_24]OGK33457.1 MAG: hypothetical protein A3E10_02465 [Candidatus Roizmanbacteria bacterium RIFCSPHIGHO2_12_FULL_37_23]OGK43546.1 MAG: hypothetical protein A2956_02405 [Candidatus Roizmanbacteria bacterium RIFCSPLOWO2_01_FULL_37_57]OGK54035.1 MAG: hypothetical protein A3H80_01750 [Ca
MALYTYKRKSTGIKRRIFTVISYASMTIGALFLFFSFYPVIASELYSRIFISRDFTDPIPYAQATSVDKAGSIRGTSNKFSTNLVDYTKASNWFLDEDSEVQRGIRARPDIKEYSISIPKIGVKNAKVIIGGDDLLAGIIHYRPDTLPGENGVVNLFGHSSLLSLYKENDPKHIFSYVPFLENSDVIYVVVDGVKYTYEVYDKIVVKPQETSVLDPKYDGAYLNLITCLPHGTYINRGIVKAKLKSLPLL